MGERWNKTRVMIVVRTYPVPATKGIEVSCTAAITESRKWVRLFPIPYRFLDEDKRFKKYQWIDVSTIKANGDPRPESFKINDSSITIIRSEDSWTERRRLLGPLFSKSLCEIQRIQRERGFPTLGIFKPKEIKRLIIDASAQDWTAKQLLALNQGSLAFQKAPEKLLEKIPFDFKYSFRCNESSCRGHELTCTDWEMGQAYRQWRQKYGEHWQSKFRERFEGDMQAKFDTHFFVGTLHQHPKNWIIVGLFYPPKPVPLALFPGV